MKGFGEIGKDTVDIPVESGKVKGLTIGVVKGSKIFGGVVT